MEKSRRLWFILPALVAGFIGYANIFAGDSIQDGTYISDDKDYRMHYIFGGAASGVGLATFVYAISGVPSLFARSKQ